MKRLHENIINYLMGESAFAQVDASMKMAATSGEVKKQWRQR